MEALGKVLEWSRCRAHHPEVKCHFCLFHIWGPGAQGFWNFRVAVLWVCPQ